MSLAIAATLFGVQALGSILGGAEDAKTAARSAKGEIFDILVDRAQAGVSAARELEDIAIGRRRSMARITAVGAAGGAANLASILTDASKDYRIAAGRVAQDLSTTQQTLDIRARNVRKAGKQASRASVVSGAIGAVGAGVNAFGALS